MPKQYEIGTAGVSRLLHYSTRSTVLKRIRRKDFPKPDIYEYWRGSPRWYVSTIAKWLSENPDMLKRVSDQRMLKMVSEVCDE